MKALKLDSTSRIFAQKSHNTHHADVGYVVSVILLSGLGLVSLYFSSANFAVNVFGDELYFVKRQFLSFAIGFFFLAIMSVISFDFLRKLLPYIYIGTIILCLMTFLPYIGVDRNGARRWIRFPIIGTIQPSELAKFTIIMFLANWCDKRGKLLNDSSFGMWQVVVGMFTIVLIVFLQNDFSTAFFLMIVGLSMLFIAGLKITWFIGFCVFSLPIVIFFTPPPKPSPKNLPLAIARDAAFT